MDSTLTHPRDGQISRMVRRRRTILIACGVLAVVVGLAGWLGSRGGRVEVNMVFIGVTNYAMPLAASGTGTATSYHTQACAMVIMSNVGSVPFSLSKGHWQDMFLEKTSYPRLNSYDTITCFPEVPQEIKAGEAKVLMFAFPAPNCILRAHVGVAPVGFRDRIAGWFFRRDLATIGSKLARPRDTNSLVWATTGWITNTPASR
jgi:hypothetical protein